MNPLWVHVPSLEASTRVMLSDDERRHLAARRVREGDPLVPFDGRGRVAEARLLSLRKREAEIEIDEVREHPRPTDSFLLASAIPKAERLSTMLQMISQLGLTRWQPLSLDDSATRKLDPKSPRLSRILIESCKVARRPWALEVEAVAGLNEVLGKISGVAPAAFGDREGGVFDRAGRRELFLIGPEAGFSEGERRVLAEHGAVPTALGNHNLRIETAVIAAAALHQQSDVVNSSKTPSKTSETKASHGSD